MGDIILTSYVIRLLKKRFPDAAIDFLVKKQFISLIQYNPNIHQKFVFHTEKGFSDIFRLIKRIRKQHYDAVIDLQRNLRSAIVIFFSGIKWKFKYRPKRWERFWLVHFHRDIYKEVKPIPLRYLEAVSSWGIEDDGMGIEIFMDSSAKETVENMLKKVDIKKEEEIVLLAPGAGRNTKRWPAERYGEVGDYFNNKGKHVILVGGEMDRACANEVSMGMKTSSVNFTGLFSLMETAALIEKAALLVTNDTGLMHMGVALNRNVVAIFGPTTYHLGFAPFRDRSIVVEKSIPCRPCSYHGTDKCPKGHFRCMLDIPSDEVIRACEILLN
jgi:lipopolysaccharide heptosyltransferase II